MISLLFQVHEDGRAEPLWAWLGLHADDVTHRKIRMAMFALHMAPQDRLCSVVDDSFNPAIRSKQLVQIQRHAQERLSALGQWQTWLSATGVVLLAVGSSWSVWTAGGCWAAAALCFTAQFFGCRVPQHLATPISLLPRHS